MLNFQDHCYSTQWCHFTDQSLIRSIPIKRNIFLLHFIYCLFIFVFLWHVEVHNLMLYYSWNKVFMHQSQLLRLAFSSRYLLGVLLSWGISSHKLEKKNIETKLEVLKVLVWWMLFIFEGKNKYNWPLNLMCRKDLDESFTHFDFGVNILWGWVVLCQDPGVV